MISVATKEGRKTNHFPPSLLVLLLDVRSEIRDPRWIKIRIRDKHPGSATLRFANPKCLTRSSTCALVCGSLYNKNDSKHCGRLDHSFLSFLFSFILAVAAAVVSFFALATSSFLTCFSLFPFPLKGQ